MIWKTKTHEYSATVCQRTGKTCPALARLARSISEAMKQATAATSDGFEFEGGSELSHCTQGCHATFRAQSDRIRIFCDTQPEAEPQDLNAYADLIFGNTFSTLPSGIITDPPCAMIDVAKLRPRKPVHAPEQISA
ncbi:MULTISPECIES: hypothetical protein [unclassified Ruegeria]|uniref:hypothetical protein n=1 Tax=unclassified Ruegeria TaxID=2625375 RepID=UPI001490A405|nr:MULTISPECIES: hypothetical protein [unclassified Ruegeria]NOD32949.1 hypothetical protein [Ruegeria sp. HKCCD7296]NOE42663.1 hypothetical protein [Ruegeria sp. HKCCD7319]